jgi:L-alanine-DL-glutamate epimerase-like enolase superfamily enzyme
MHRRRFLQVAGALATTFLPAIPALAQLRPQPIKSVRAAVIQDVVVVEVETESGLRGHGFSAITNLPVVVSIVRDVIAAALKGEDALAREAIYDRLQRLLVLRGLIAGHAMHAISAVDIALWDIAGKLAQQPVWRLLGGARAVVPAYTTFGLPELDRDALAEAARAQVESGQKRLKMVVAADVARRRGEGGNVEDSMREDMARIAAVRDAAGPDAQIMIDANHGFDPYEARRFADMIKGLNIALFEEPIRGNDVLRLADLRRQCAIPLGAGQNEGHIARWRDMALNGAVDLLQLNVGMCGGYTGALKIAGLAEAFSLPIANGGGYALFNMHLHAGISNGGMVEWHVRSVALERAIYDRTFALDGDRLHLPEGPGLGFDLRPDIRRQLSA